MAKNLSLEELNAKIAEIIQSGRSKAPGIASEPLDPKGIADFTKVLDQQGVTYRKPKA